MNTPPNNILITGAGGYIGSMLVKQLAAGQQPASIIAMDVKEIPEESRMRGVEYVREDIRSEDLAAMIVQHKIHTVVHLAAIVTPTANSTREFEYSVDVLGTKNLMEACVCAGVTRVIVTSSGAAYGYHADNPEWLSEEDAIRGNKEFPYAYHKRLVEEMMAEYRVKHPKLEQVVFRVATILGKKVNNRISNMFERKTLITVKRSKSPYVFIWDEDLVGCLERAVFSGKPGVYNVAGDGAISIYDLAKMAGKRCRSVPVWLIRGALFVLNRIGLSRSGPEVVYYLLYRPVLSNERLKNVFGYIPKMTSKQVYTYFLATRERAYT